MIRNASVVIQAIIWANISSLASAVMVSLVRHVSVDMNVAEIIFIRNIFAFMMFLPFLWFYGLAEFKTNNIKLHMMRSITGVIAMMAFFYGISKINLSLVTAISFTAPLFMAIIAYFFLKDKFGKYRTASLAVGFIGALIVIRPGFEAYNEYSLFVVFAALFWALSGVLIKLLSATESPMVITFYMTIFMAIFSAPVAAYFWQTPTYDHLFWIFLIAFFSNILQFSLAKALSLVDMSVILPVDFTRIIYTAIIAYIFFGEVMDIPATIGSAVIIASAAFTAYRQNKVSKIKPKLDNPE